MPKHIEDKDRGDAVSKILGDAMTESKNNLLQLSFEQLLKNSNEDVMEWYRKQNSKIKVFNQEVDKQVNEETKRVIKAISEGSDVLNLTTNQKQELQQKVNLGMQELGSSIQKNHLFDVTRVVSTKKLETNEKELFSYIQKTIQARENLGVVTYKDGKNFKWENYYEMRVRTDIAHDLTDNMIKDGSSNGVVFYICTYLGDCAPDHADYQGKIYVDESWTSNVSDEETKAKIEAYIKVHKVMTVQEVTSSVGNWLTTRPNCRHFFQYISVEEVLGITNEKELNSKREELSMNFEGKYKPEKYEALAKQRYNERAIRDAKGKLEAAELAYSKAQTTQAKAIALADVNKYKFQVRQRQAAQRAHLKKNTFLERNYDREAYRRMISDGGLRREDTIKYQREEYQKILNNLPESDKMTIEEISNPQFYMENCKSRIRYHKLLDEAKENIPKDLSLKEQALWAFNKRIEIREQIREKMVDDKAKKYLCENDPNTTTFEALVEKKKKKYGFTNDDDVYKSIKDSMNKERVGVDALFYHKINKRGK